MQKTQGTHINIIYFVQTVSVCFSNKKRLLLRDVSFFNGEHFDVEHLSRHHTK